ncbi:hypothetical protein C7974DRAFT_377651 [Boeremia exigua]|uniref:uncharacterized protein n=1 Tax=Boeremia exigua TaxID=749465 RepID=UPI001E8D8FFB|nr:uncharacterized protein C7974DRAFT_377651 [Boeremia exigua]KAH6622026.1 hypothetical protein C7974DRAFT_377651 [Boeremia exigua]
MPAPMQPHNQADDTIRDLRARMGEDVGLLSYLPDEKVQTAFVDYKAEIGHTLSTRILFGEIKRDRSSTRDVWALLHSKPGGRRPPEARLRLYSRDGHPEEPITLEEAIEQVSPTAAFACLQPKHGRFDRAHLRSVLGYYFVLQKLQIPSSWPMSERFVSDLRSACKVARANMEDEMLASKSSFAGAPNNMAPARLQDAEESSAESYTISHKAVKGSRSTNKQTIGPIDRSKSLGVLSPAKRKLLEHDKPSLEEELFGEAAEASLLSHRESASLTNPIRSSRSPAPSLIVDKPEEKAEIFVELYKQSVTENELRERRLEENKDRQGTLRTELKDLEKEEERLTDALCQSRQGMIWRVAEQSDYGKTAPRDLLGVLDSLPEPGSFNFQETQWLGHAAIKLCLGNRPRLDGTPCRSWACIVTSEINDLNPPIIFYDQDVSEDGTRTSESLRSASALLRRATDLLPPFRFLQHDPIDEMRGSRNMICAIILYQALMSGLETCALQWEQFRDSLSQALRYIASRDAYHQWRHDQKIIATRRLVSSREQRSGKVARQVDDGASRDSSGEELDTASTSNNETYTGGVVRPSGIDIAIRPNTSLAKLKVVLGDKKFRLLDKMPQHSMEITPHSLGPPYFPFRMLISRHVLLSGQPFKVYAYLEHDRLKKTAMKFLGYDSAGREQSFTVDQLLGSRLLEPLEFLNNLKKSTYAKNGSGASSARTAKIRSIVSYYFFLAENEGLIGDPRVSIGDAFGKRLCAALTDLQEANFGDEENTVGREVDESWNDDTDVDTSIARPAVPVEKSNALGMEPARQEETYSEPSHMVTLTVQSTVLQDITKDRPLRRERESSSKRMRLRQHQGSPNKLSLGDSPAEHAPMSQHEKRRSPQVAYASSEISTAIIIDQGDERQALAEPSEVSASPHTPGVKQSQARTREASPIFCYEQTAGSFIRAEMTSIEEIESGVQLHGEESETALGNQMSLAISKSFADTRATKDTLSAEEVGSGLYVADARRSSGAETVPTGVSSPAPLRQSSPAPSTAVKKDRASSESDDPLVSSQDANVRVAQVLDIKPLTPEGSVERELKAQRTAVGMPDNIPQNQGIFDLCSDSEDVIIPLPCPGTVVSRRLEGGFQPIDLTQLSSPRSKKRKSSDIIHLLDSEDDTIEETDGSAHRRAMSRRRK